MAKVRAENWKVEWLSTPYYGWVSPEGKRTFVLPRYQRQFVWGTNNRASLINSMKSDFPVGALILRDTGLTKSLKDRHGHVQDCTVYEIIDGLQRSTSLIYHQLHPLALVSKETVAGTATRVGVDLSAVAQSLGSVLSENLDESNLASAIAKFARDSTRKQLFGESASSESDSDRYWVDVFDKNEYTSNKLYFSLAKQFNGDTPALVSHAAANKVTDDIDGLLGKMLDEENLESKTIPVILWSGSAEQAAIIFERVNQGGVKLSKYQQLAASWASEFTDFKGGPITKAAAEALLPPEGSQLIQKDHKKDQPLDLYEALVGMSQVLVNRFPEIFPTPRKSKDDGNVLERKPISYAAFNIASIICKTKLTDMRDLVVNASKKCDYIRDSNGDVSYQLLWDAIENSTKIVSASIPALKYATGSPTLAHSEASMVAIIARWAILWLQTPVSSRRQISTLSKKIIPGHYIADMIGGITDSHATDAAAFSRVWDVETVGTEQVMSPSDYYITQIPKENLERELDTYWIKQQDKKVDALNKAAPTIDAKQKMMLRLFASQSANWAAIEGSAKYHVDHSIPFSRIKKWSQANKGAEYAGGSIANLAFLPEEMNLKKSKRTIDEWLAGKKTGLSISPEQLWSLVPYGPGELAIPAESDSKQPTVKDFDRLMLVVWLKMKKTYLAIGGHN
ncbi:MAG: DUF262 domain-containing protein [Microbacteriaceae bacterium]